MTKRKTFASVTEMVNAISEDRNAATTIRKRLAQQEIVSQLFAIRTAKGLSQADIAKRMDCTQSRVSKFENSVDNDISVGDLASYLDAVDLQLVRAHDLATECANESSEVGAEERRRRVFTKVRECCGFTKWQQGFTPKEHVEMMQDAELKAWQERREAADAQERREREQRQQADDSRRERSQRRHEWISLAVAIGGGIIVPWWLNRGIEAPKVTFEPGAVVVQPAPALPNPAATAP